VTRHYPWHRLPKILVCAAEVAVDCDLAVKLDSLIEPFPLFAMPLDALFPFSLATLALSGGFPLPLDLRSDLVRPGEEPLAGLDSEFFHGVTHGGQSVAHRELLEIRYVALQPLLQTL